MERKDAMSRSYVFALALAMGTVAAPLAFTSIAQTQDTPQDSSAAAKADHGRQGQTQNQSEDEGQRVFEQNCSRCHNAPEGFSPRISGTIVRHMRVRANLSEHDEQLLLKFFNP
jgi:cytochrome c5